MLATDLVDLVSFGTVIFLTGAESGGGNLFFRGFFTLEFGEIFGLRVPEAVWDGDVPLSVLRWLDWGLACNFLSRLPGATFLAGGFGVGFADGLGTFARWTLIRLESDALLVVGDSGDTIDIIFAIMSLRWLNAMTVATAITNSTMNRYRNLRRRRLLFELSTCLGASGFGNAGWDCGGGESFSIFFKAFKIELNIFFLDQNFRGKV